MKNTNLAEALQQTVTRQKPTHQPRQQKHQPRRATTKSNTAIPPSRIGKKTVAGHFDIAVSNQLKIIGMDTGDRKQQALLQEALNDLFKKYGKPPIA